MEDKLIELLFPELLKGKKENKKVLLLITAGSIDVKEIFTILDRAKNVDYKYIKSEATKNVSALDCFYSLGEEVIGIENILNELEETDLIVLPTLTRNTLFKASMGFTDNDLLTALQFGLMQEKKIVSLDCSFNPKSQYFQYINIDKNENYNNYIYERKNQLKDLGVDFYNLLDFKNFFENFIKEEEKDNNLNQIINLLEKIVIEEQEKKAVVEVDKDEEESSEFLRGPITYSEVVNKKEVYLEDNAQLTDMAKDYINRNKTKVYRRK